MRHDVLTARERLNFQTLGFKPIALQKATLYEAVNMVQLGAMLLSRFRQIHPEANVTPQELETLKAYLAPGTITPDQPGNQAYFLIVTFERSVLRQVAGSSAAETEHQIDRESKVFAPSRQNRTFSQACFGILA